jgi:chlorobactene glucosyltransferase
MSGFAMQEAAIVGVLVVLLLIALSNMRTLRRMEDHPRTLAAPSVSILVPARNEEFNIAPCVRSLLAQDYPHFHILVLDDESTDGTWETLQFLVRGTTQLHVINGKPLPFNWIGKNWACHQLYEAANGELLLFTDADTTHGPGALRSAVNALLSERADLVTALPHEQVITWAEKLIVPMVPWTVFAFLPLSLAYRLNAPSLSACVGQFMMFRRGAYEAIGGHASVRQHAADDLALVRRIKSHGLCWRLLDGTNSVQCRMYRTPRQVFAGFNKNLFASFNYNLPVYLFTWLLLGVVFLQPPVMIILAITALEVSALALTLAIIAVGGALLLWVLANLRFGFAIHLALFYPISLFIAMAVAASSLTCTLLGRTSWKGRRLAR